MLKAHNIYYNSFRIEIYVHKFHAGAKQGKQSVARECQDIRSDVTDWWSNLPAG